MKICGSFVMASLLAVSLLAGVPVEVTINGRVESNGIRSGPLAVVAAGDPTTMSFMVDSDVFTDNPSFPTRGYDIDQTSFVWTLGGVDVGLQSPFPAGLTPFFVIRNDDPAVDGFFLSTGLDLDFPLPTDEPGLLGPFGARFNVTYLGTMLSTLDILDAVGTYDFTDLTVYGHAVTDASFDAMLIEYVDLTIGATTATPLLYRASVDVLTADWKTSIPLPLGASSLVDPGWPLSFSVPGSRDDATGYASTSALLLYRALDASGAPLTSPLKLVKNSVDSVIVISVD